MLTRPRRSKDAIRWGGAVGVLLACLLIPSWLPTRPATVWEPIHGFQREDAECSAFRDMRSTATLAVPRDAPGPVTVAGAAAAFNLEMELVCRANALPAGCGAEDLPLPAGDLVFPLTRDPARVQPPAP